MAAGAALVALPAAAALVCAIGLALSAGTLVSGMLHWRRDSVQELALRPDGCAEWRDGHGVWHAAHQVTGGALASWAIAIGLKEAGGRLRPLLLLPDALDAAGRRELRLWLRWRPQSRRKVRMGVI